MSARRRWAVTLAAPLAAAALARIPLPGVDGGALEALGGTPELFGVLALGLAPYITAAWLVELTAFLVPRLSPLRSGAPEGRARLDRWTFWLTFALALVQGLALVRTLHASADVALGVAAPGALWTLGAVATLVAGVGVQLFVAGVVQRQRTVNGVALLVGFGFARSLVVDFVHYAHIGAHARSAGATSGAEVLRALVAIVGVASATWLVTGRGRERAATQGGGGPYRDAQRLAAEPVLPIPASSIEAYSFAVTLLALPSVLAQVGAPGAVPIATAVQAYPAPIGLFLVSVAALVFSWVLHRPKDIADLSRAFGGRSNQSAQARTRALGQSLPATLVYLVGLYGAALVLGRVTSVIAVALVTVIAADLVAAVRLSRTNPRFVAVWEERRAVAITIGEAALAGEGIAARTLGTRTLALLQIFAPYAPATFLVAPEDAARAEALLRHVLGGGPAPAPRPESDAPSREASTPRPGPLRPLLATCTIGAVLVGALTYDAPAPKVSAPPSVFALHRVTDEEDPFADAVDTAVPPSLRLMVREESVGAVRGHYATIELGGGTRREAIERATPWLSRLPVPAGSHFAFEDVTAEGGTVVAVRTFLVDDVPALTRADVSSAEAIASEPYGEWSVMIELTPKAAQTFADLTEASTGKRIAIVVDGAVMSAPIVRSRISGGRLTVTMGQGDSAALHEKAERLANGLKR